MYAIRSYYEFDEQWHTDRVVKTIEKVKRLARAWDLVRETSAAA